MSTNDTSFPEVARANRNYLCRLAGKFRVPKHEIEDLVQDTLLIGHQKWSTFEHRSSARVWLSGIMLHLLSNRRRKWSSDARKRDAYATFGHQRASLALEPFIEPHEFEEFLASLEPRERDVFVKFEIEGYKGREVAEALAVKASTAVSWLRNARLALRRRFRPNGYWTVLGAFFRPHHAPSPWSFAKGFACAAAVVAGVWVNLPFEANTAEGRSPPPAVVEAREKEAAPPPKVELPHDAQTPPEAEQGDPDGGSPARKSSKRWHASKGADSEIEGWYYARHINALGAPTCARASLESSTLPTRMRAREFTESRPKPTLWMDHVPNAGKLLESACQRTYTGRR